MIFYDTLESQEKVDDSKTLLFIVSLQCLCTYYVALVIYTCKTKCKVYLRSGFLIFGYSFMYLSRFIVQLLSMPFAKMNDGDILKNIAKSISLILLNFIWVALYFFILQIEKITLKLQAPNHTDFQKIVRQKNIFNNVLLVLYVISIVVSDVFEIGTYFNKS